MIEKYKAITPISTTGKIENGRMLISIKPYPAFKDNSSKIHVSISSVSRS